MALQFGFQKKYFRRGFPDDFLGPVLQEIFSTGIENRNSPVQIGGNDGDPGGRVKDGFSLCVGIMQLLKDTFRFLELLNHQAGCDFGRFSGHTDLFSKDGIFF